MIKLIIFDLDGVLVDAKEIHYEALNKALSIYGEQYIINRDEHISIYDGLPTTKKLSLLTERKNLPTELYKQISNLKQKYTSELIEIHTKKDNRLIYTLNSLKNDGYKIYVASNSIRETVQIALNKTGLIEYVDCFLSNEDVENPKPHPQIYLQCMVHAGVSPKECLILEDSLHGRKSALESGGNLYPVDNLLDVDYSKIKNYINSKTNKNLNIKWKSNQMNVLIPMAGLGSRFQQAGYSFPKPLIDVRNKPMIQMVVENLNIECRFIYIVQRSHYDRYNLNYLLQLISPNCEIIILDEVTEGAACTTLLAKKFIDDSSPLLIANSDQFIEWDSNDFYYNTTENIDGSILTFKSSHPKWSFVKTDQVGNVTEVAEKKPISDMATVGIYFWKRGSDYVKYAEQMIEKNIRVNNEFYVAPVYNEAINDGLKIKTYNIEKMWGLGTPEDLNYFLENNKEV